MKRILLILTGVILSISLFGCAFQAGDASTSKDRKTAGSGKEETSSESQVYGIVTTVSKDTIGIDLVEVPEETDLNSDSSGKKDGFQRPPKEGPEAGKRSDNMKDPAEKSSQDSSAKEQKTENGTENGEVTDAPAPSDMPAPPDLPDNGDPSAQDGTETAESSRPAPPDRPDTGSENGMPAPPEGGPSTDSNESADAQPGHTKKGRPADNGTADMASSLKKTGQHIDVKISDIKIRKQESGGTSSVSADSLKEGDLVRIVYSDEEVKKLILVDADPAGQKKTDNSFSSEQSDAKGSMA